MASEKADEVEAAKIRARIARWEDYVQRPPAALRQADTGQLGAEAPTSPPPGGVPDERFRFRIKEVEVGGAAGAVRGEPPAGAPSGTRSGGVGSAPQPFTEGCLYQALLAVGALVGPVAFWIWLLYGS